MSTPIVLWILREVYGAGRAWFARKHARRIVDAVELGTTAAAFVFELARRAGIEPDELASAVRDRVEHVARAHGYSPEQVAKALEVATRELGGLLLAAQMVKFNETVPKLERTIARSRELEEQRRGGK